MPPTYFPLRWESTGDQWWYASPIDYAAANGHYDLVRELLHLDTNLLIKLTSLRRIRRLEIVWDDEAQFDDVARCRSQVAKKLLLEFENKKGQNSLIRAGYGGWLLYTAASAGDVGFVKELLERDSLLVFGEGEYGVTDILYAAARSKNSEVFRFLLEYSISCNSGELEGNAEETLCDFKWEMMNRAAHAAARGGNVEILRELLGACLDILVYRDDQGCTLLHTASGRGQIEVVKELLASYDISSSKDIQGNTALHVAAYRGYLAVVEILVSWQPSSTTITNNDGDTFLHMVVAGFRTPGFQRVDRQIELMKHLISGQIVDMQAIINAQNNEGKTALHMAVTENMHSDLMELLMTIREIDLNICDNDGMTPLDLLKQSPQSASSRLLINRLKFVGGISHCQDEKNKFAIVSHLRMQGIGRSPGTSFRLPDADIVPFTATDNARVYNYNTAYDTCSGELSHCGSLDKPDNKKFSSVNIAKRHLQILPHWSKKKDTKIRDRPMEDDDSMGSYSSVNGGSNYNQGSLRQRFSRNTSLFNNKRILPFQSTLPSPSTKQKFASGLMHGVLQVSLDSPSSNYSESSKSSPISFNKFKGNILDEDGCISSSNSLVNTEEKSQRHRRHGSFNKRLMNQYFCFGAQGIAVDDAVNYARQAHQNYKHPILK